MNRFENVPTTILGTGYLNEPHMSVVSVNDCSSSVAGVMAQMNRGRAHFKQKVCENAKARELVDIAMVNVASDVQVMRLRDIVTSEGDEDGAGPAVAAADVPSASDLDEADAAFVPVKDLPDITLKAHGLTRLNDGIERALNLVHDHAQRQLRAGINVKRSLVLIYTDGRDEPAGNVDEAAELIAKMVAKDQVKVVFLGFGDFDRATAEQLTKSCGGYFEANFDASDGVPFDRFFHFMSEIACGMSQLAPGTAIATTEAFDGDDDDIRFVCTDGVTTFEEFCK